MSAPWYHDDWPYRQRLKMNATLIDEVFQVLPIPGSLFNKHFFLNSKSGGEDVRFTADDGTTELAIHVLKHTPSTETGRYFADVHTVSNISTDVYIWAYYGNAGASAYSASATYGANAVYSAEAGRYYPGESLLDFTNQASGRALTAVNTPGTAASGLEGITAATYNGTDQGHYSSVTPAVVSPPHSMEVLFNPSNITHNGIVFSIAKNTSTTNHTHILVYGSGGLGDRIAFTSLGNGGSEAGAQTSSSFSAAAWQSAAGSRSGTGTTGTSTAYLSGGNAGTNTTTTVETNAPNRTSIGVRMRSTPDLYFNGSVACAVLSASELSANRIATHHNSWFNSSFLTAHEIETPNGGMTGWRLFGTAAQTTLGGSNADWSNVNNALSVNADAATVVVDDGGVYESEFLKLTNLDYGITIPSGEDTYTGEFLVSRSFNSGGAREIEDLSVRFIDNTGTYAGTDMAATGVNWSTGVHYKTYTIAGVTLSETKFDADSGIAIQVTGWDTNGATTASIVCVWGNVAWETSPGADVTGTAAAVVSVVATASGARGVAGTAAAAVSVVATASGFRGVLGTVAAAVSVAATATGFRGAYGAVTAALDLVASALGLRGVLGTAAAEVDVSGHASDGTSEKIGTVAADLVVSARAVGYVGGLGPADGRALQPYLTGAVATGAPARDLDSSTGGFRSGVRFRAMEWDSPDPLIGVSLLEVGGGNGIDFDGASTGLGSLTAATADSVTWTPPGGTAGAAVSLAVDGEIVAPGASTGAWVRLRRSGANPLEGAHSVQCIDIYNNLFPDVVTADAVAGLVTARALMLLNTAGAVIDFRAWLGTCDDDFELALETPVAGELLGAGLTWSSATTAETGPLLSLVGADVEIGLHVRRTVAADTAPSPSRVWEVLYRFSDGTSTYTGAVRGRYRIEREDYEKEGIWIGIGQDPDFDGAPEETWTTTPHTTSLGLTLPAVVHAARRAMNKWGMWGIPTEVVVYNLDASGDSTRLAPSGPMDVSVMQTSGNKPTVAGTYDAAADEDDRAEIWAIWLETDGTDPDGSGDPAGYALVQHNGAIDDLAWTSTGAALSDGTPVKALVRLRRLDASGTAHSPDVIQLGASGAGTLKFNVVISGWSGSGYLKITAPVSGKLLEVVHYSGIVVASGQTTVTVDERALMGTSAGATTRHYLVAPFDVVDSTNTAVATWEITAVAPGRPGGALLYGDRGAQAQAAVEGPDGVTPQVLDAGENVHLVLGEGWSSLYVDTVLVWRCLFHGESGEANGLYVPSEWTVVTGAISGAASGPGVVDVVDSDTIYLVVNGVRRVLIDLAAMEITAASWNGEESLVQKAEQDGALDQFGATLLLVWDPEREDYRPYLQVTAAGAVNVATAMVETMTTVEVEGLWN